MKIYFEYNGNYLTFNENIRYDFSPNIYLTQGTVTTASGFDFSFERSKYRRILHSLTWPVLKLSKYREMIEWIKIYPQGKLNDFTYSDPEGILHTVKLATDILSFKQIGNSGQYVTGEIELLEMEKK